MNKKLINFVIINKTQVPYLYNITTSNLSKKLSAPKRG